MLHIFVGDKKELAAVLNLINSKDKNTHLKLQVKQTIHQGSNIIAKEKSVHT